jgi:chloramphenicol 3-O phosphotransferase
VFGTIILLNGTVSAGKTSLARGVQHVMEEPYLHLGADFLGAMCAPRYAGGTHAAEGFAWVPVEGAEPPMTALVAGPYGHQIVEGLHEAIAALARSGHNVVVDHILRERRWLRHCLEAWKNLPVLFVGVRCPLAIAEERERERGNRVLGVARWEFDRVHTYGHYDLEIDTSLHRPRTGAELIAGRLHEGPAPTAFHALAEQHGQ